MTENQKIKIIRVELLETFAEINDTLKADKDVEAVVGNLAKFDENGNPVDSGINVNDLSAVATTGDYNDLSNKPTIPSVGNAEIEIQKNGTKINSFTTNQSGSKVTINIPVPTGTAADKDIPSSGDASSTQVVLGNDTRLSDSRPASDVYSWAKAESKPSYTKSEIGLENVTNDSQVKRSEMGVASGVATLNENGKVPSSQLPGYVDDAIELLAMKDTAPSTCVTGDQYYNTSSAKIFTATNTNIWSTTGETPEKGKIYINLSNDRTYRWGGSAMIPIKGDLVIGTGAGDAADGQVTNNHITDTNNPHGVTKSQVGLGNVGNFKAVSTEASQGLTDTEKSNARANIGAGTSSFSGSYNDLTNKPTIPDAQIQSDWNQSDNTKKDYVKNKPSSMPASDVSAWAKAASKPSYTKSEVGLGNVDNTADANKSVNYATSSGDSDKIDGYHITVVTEMPNTPSADTIYIVK